MRRVRAIVDTVMEHNSPKASPSSSAAADNNSAAADEGVCNGSSDSHSSNVTQACLAYKNIKLPERLAADAAHALFSSILKLEGENLALNYFYHIVSRY